MSVKFRDLYVGYVIDWSFYPQTVVDAPVLVSGRTWKVRVYNSVTGTAWFEGSADDTMQCSATAPDYGPHPTADDWYAEQARLRDVRIAKEQREHAAWMAKITESNAREQAKLDSMIAAREAREAKELERLLDPENAF